MTEEQIRQAIEKRREYQKRWREEKKKDPGWVAQERARLERWAEEHREQERERSKERYQRDKEYYKEKNSRWFREHREWDRERKRKDYALDPVRENKRYLRWKHRLNLPDDQFEALWQRLHGPCEICGAINQDGERMHYDHDHRTSKFRGALCHRCNLAIGHFRDDPALLRKAADYLERVNPTFEGGGGLKVKWQNWRNS